MQDCKLQKLLKFWATFSYTYSRSSALDFKSSSNLRLILRVLFNDLLYNLP